MKLIDLNRSLSCFVNKFTQSYEMLVGWQT